MEIKDYKFMLVNSIWGCYQDLVGGMIGLKLQTSEEGQEHVPEWPRQLY